MEALAILAVLLIILPLPLCIYLMVQRSKDLKRIQKLEEKVLAHRVSQSAETPPPVVTQPTAPRPISCSVAQRRVRSGRNFTINGRRLASGPATVHVGGTLAQVVRARGRRLTVTKALVHARSRSEAQLCRMRWRLCLQLRSVPPLSPQAAFSVSQRH